jgi:hypothetical protein
MFADKKKILIFAGESAGVAQLVEHDLAKVGVAGSSPVSRSNKKIPDIVGDFYLLPVPNQACLNEEPAINKSATQWHFFV